MKKRNLFFGGLAGLLFITFTALNLTISQNYQGQDVVNRFTLTELAAEAQGGAGEFHGCYPLPALAETWTRCYGDGPWAMRCACGFTGCLIADQQLCPSP